jgi:hypothetical protein
MKYVNNSRQRILCIKYANLLLSTFLSTCLGNGNDEYCDEIIQGYLIDEDRLCATTSNTVEMGCRDPLRYPQATYGCWESSNSGIHVFTWNYYFELTEQGWYECDVSYSSTFFASSMICP